MSCPSHGHLRRTTSRSADDGFGVPIEFEAVGQAIGNVVPRTGVESGMAQVTMYTTSWCGYCVRLKAQLGRAGVAFDEVNIGRHHDAAELVASLNNGNQTVPTLVFADGSALTNPSTRQVQERLAGLA